METPRTRKQQQQEDNHLSASILFAVDMEANFKLYSYRIIDKDIYIARTKELVQIFNKATNGK